MTIFSINCLLTISKHNLIFEHYLINNQKCLLCAVNKQSVVRRISGARTHTHARARGLNRVCKCKTSVHSSVNGTSIIVSLIYDRPLPVIVPKTDIGVSPRTRMYSVTTAVNDKPGIFVIYNFQKYRGCVSCLHRRTSGMQYYYRRILIVIMLRHILCLKNEYLFFVLIQNKRSPNTTENLVAHPST